MFLTYPASGGVMIELETFYYGVPSSMLEEFCELLSLVPADVAY